jgi:uncharacterized protein (DUF427 family)
MSSFSFAPPLHVAPTPRWVRVRAGEQWVADSRRALLLAWYGPGMLPTYFFPPEDVRADLISPSGHDGDGPYVAHDLQAGDATLAGAARRLRDPSGPLAPLAEHWTFTWDDPGLAWFEEAFQVHVHARDPSKRVDVVPSERHVRVEVAGELVAESRRPHALFESWLPTRWYLPREDVREDLLEPSEHVTRCPYKGTASYFSVRAGGELHPNLLWTYPEPIPECPRIAGLVSFFNEKVDLTVDGERQERPVTPWS